MEEAGGNYQQAQEDLRFIREMMEKTRQQVADNGMHYISWTILVALGIISTYIVVLYDYPEYSIFWIWLVFMGSGWLVSYLIGRNEVRSRSHNFAEKVLSAVWAGTGVTMTIVVLTGVTMGVFDPNLIPAFIAAVLGIPYFTASYVYDLSFFRVIAVGWWIAGIGFFVWNSFHALAAFGVLMLLLQAVPGLYLYKNFGTEQANAQ